MNRDLTIAAKPPVRAMTSFARNEDGTILFFAVAMMLVMLMVAGMGLDIMKFETIRTELQQTSDRATLASASLTQELDPEAVARDYFEKAGLTDKLTMVEVTTGLNFRTVEVRASAKTNPIFLDLYDPQHEFELNANAVSVAEQRITNVEVVMVLDVSGSMAGAKLANLKTAAKEFVETVISADGEGRISIAIVPYNSHVNMPQYLQDLFVDRVDDHDIANVNCFDLPASVYNSLGMSTSTPLPVTGHVDTRSTTSRSSKYVKTSDTYAVPNESRRWCKASTTNVILPPTNDIGVLQAHIENLQAGGNTSINTGMKWGMTLLDPGSRGIISEMVAQGHTPAQFEGRPFDYADDDSIKVVVLMTDGAHVPEDRLKDGYRTDESPIYLGNDGYYSIYHNRSGTSYDYWVPHRKSGSGEWRTQPWPDSSRATRQTWDKVWSKVRMTWVAWQLYARAFGNSYSAYNNAMNTFRTTNTVSKMDAQLQSLCTAAREQEVIVYGIAFEAPPNGAAQIESCSMTPSHFFNADGLEIQSAFRAIASNLSQLRLTQ